MDFLKITKFIIKDKSCAAKNKDKVALLIEIKGVESFSKLFEFEDCCVKNKEKNVCMWPGIIEDTNRLINNRKFKSSNISTNDITSIVLATINFMNERKESFGFGNVDIETKVINNDDYSKLKISYDLANRFYGWSLN